MYLERRILRYLDILMVALTFAYFSLISTNYFIIVYASIGAVNDYTFTKAVTIVPFA